jgi:hypothetical protein
VLLLLLQQSDRPWERPFNHAPRRTLTPAKVAVGACEPLTVCETGCGGALVGALDAAAAAAAEALLSKIVNQVSRRTMSSAAMNAVTYRTTDVLRFRQGWQVNGPLCPYLQQGKKTVTVATDCRVNVLCQL